MIDGYIMHVQGLSWRRLGADEMGGEQVSARRQKTSEEGQDMRNPWHQNSVEGKSQAYVVCVCVCAVYPEMHQAQHGWWVPAENTRGVFGCYRTLGYVIVNLIFYFECTSLARFPAADGGAMAQRCVSLDQHTSSSPVADTVVQSAAGST